MQSGGNIELVRPVQGVFDFMGTDASKDPRRQHRTDPGRDAVPLAGRNRGRRDALPNTPPARCVGSRFHFIDASCGASRASNLTARRE